MRIILIAIFISSSLVIYGQSETEKVIDAIINIDKDLNETDIIVCERLEDYTDSTIIQNVTTKYGELSSEDILYIKFGNIGSRLLSMSALIELDKIAKKLNRCRKGKDYPLTGNELAFDIFERSLCFFSKPLFNKNRDIALVKYYLTIGNPLSYEDSSSTYLLEKREGKWRIKECLENVI